MSLDKRVTELEKRHSLSEGTLVWILSLARAKDGKAIERDPVALTTADGLRWDRGEGESLEDFRERAKQEVLPRTAKNFAVLREEYQLAETN